MNRNQVLIISLVLIILGLALDDLMVVAGAAVLSCLLYMSIGDKDA